MIYLHNPEKTGADIKNVIVGNPGDSRKYGIKKGETFGFEDNVALYIIKIYGVEDGDQRGMNRGFLQIVEPVKKVKAETIVEEVDGKKVWKCSLCDFESDKAALPVHGHINREHPDEKEVQTEGYQVQEGEKIVPPAEIDRLRRERQEVSSMRPKRSLVDLQPKTEEETGYRRRVDIRDSGLDTDPKTASSFYGPGLQEDTNV